MLTAADSSETQNRESDCESHPNDRFFNDHLSSHKTRCFELMLLRRGFVMLMSESQTGLFQLRADLICSVGGIIFCFRIGLQFRTNTNVELFSVLSGGLIMLEVEAWRHEEQPAPLEVSPHLAGSLLIMLTWAHWSVFNMFVTPSTTAHYRSRCLWFIS